MKPTKVEKEEWKLAGTFITTIMGMLVGLTPIIIIQSSFPIEVGIILFFLNNTMIIDNWWQTLKFIDKYNLRTGKTLFITLIDYHQLILLSVWLLAAGRDLLPLSGYLLMWDVGVTVDLVWDLSVLRDDPSIIKKEECDVKAWITGDLIGLFLFSTVYALLVISNVGPLAMSIVFCTLFVSRRLLDFAISKMLFRRDHKRQQLHLDNWMTSPKGTLTKSS